MSVFDNSQLSFELPDRVFPGQLICPEYDVTQNDGKTTVYKFVSGHGTKVSQYHNDGNPVAAVTATILGIVKADEKDYDISRNDETKEDLNPPVGTNNADSARTKKTITISVIQTNSTVDSGASSMDFANNLPKEGDIVLTRVTRISLQRTNVEILAVENAAVPIDSGVGSNGSGIVAAQGGSGAATFSIAQASSDLGETFRGIIRSQDVRATERDTVKIIDCFKPGDIVRAQVLSLGDGTNYYLSTAKNDLGVVFAKSSNGAGGLMYALDWQTMCVPSTGATEKRKCAKPF